MLKNLYLVDVSSIFFRSFYAIRNLSNSKGIPTNATYGFMAAITKILKEHNPDGIVFCLDRPEAGVREEWYADYKANRDEPPDELQKQFPYIRKVAEALNIPCFDSPGYEADDVIGTIAQRAVKDGINAVIVSGDKDFGQLVQPGIRIFDPAKDHYIDAAEVRGKWGIDPHQVIDYLALVGDSSDNVPGVAGIGPKGAQKLLTQFGSLDEIYKNADQIANERLREKLLSSKEMAYLSQKLVTIHTDVNIKYTWDELRLRPINRDVLVNLMEELEFKTMLQRFLGPGASYGNPSAEAVPAKGPAPVISVASTPTKVVVVSELKKLDQKLGQAKNLWVFASDRGVALSGGDEILKFEGSISDFKSWLATQLFDHKRTLSCFDTKDVLHWVGLKPDGIQIADDLLLASYCLGDQDDLSFEALAGRYLGKSIPEFAGADERLVFALDMMSEARRLLKERGLERIYQTIECPITPVLYEMEFNGILIDTNALNEQSKTLAVDAGRLEKEIASLAGESFNVGSPKQLSKILFDKLKLPVIRKTKTGFSTDSDVLEKLKHQHPICEKILEWRELSKLKSTYVDALPRLKNEKTGRVHTTFNQALTSTGRLSSHNPNLQNIPIRSKRGQMIREAFIAPEGKVLVSADYSQVELRILAHISDDPGLKRAFTEDLDIHQATAAEVFGVALKDVTANQRRAAKAINFGIAYGMSDFGLSESLSIDRREAADYIAKYFSRYPKVHQYMQDIVEEGKRHGYVETMFGRRRYYPAIKASNRRVAQMAERAVINMPIQGAAADIMKLAMIQIHEKLNSWTNDGAKLLLQVHDELVFEIAENKADPFASEAKTWMETAVTLSVPLKVSVGFGKTWGQAH